MDLCCQVPNFSRFRWFSVVAQLEKLKCRITDDPVWDVAVWVYITFICYYLSYGISIQATT
jgi:hypothetical protein